MKNYPYKTKAKLCYHSPTSKRVRCGRVTVHMDKDTGREYVMTRAVGGGTERRYNWRRHFKPT